MAAATDIQMQKFCDERLRQFAEKARALKVLAADHVAAIDDCYARAVSNSRWTDGRTDGPPHLLQSGNSASPDDLLNFNSFLSLLGKFFAGTFADLTEANSAAAMWLVLQDACVQPVQG